MDFVIRFFDSLPHDIEYAIERGLREIRLSAKGDLDVVIRKAHFPALLEIARQEGILISVSITYGGARIFLGNGKDELKRVDFDWLIHYRGISMHPAEYYLAARCRDQETGLFVLPDKQHAEIIWFIKNCYGGADKYRNLLEHYNHRVLTKKQRLRLLSTIIIHHPFKALAGKFRYLVCYLFRMAVPTGLVISGRLGDVLRAEPGVMYLFQGRVSSCGNFGALLRSRIFSQLCAVSGARFSDIDLDNSEDPHYIADTVTSYLRHKRVRAPRSLFAIA